MDINELGSIPRRTMVLFLLIDTSGSMSGNKIGQVNAAIEEMLPMIQEISDENADAKIKLAIMSFSTGIKWHTTDDNGNDGPQELETIMWRDMTAGGLTELGAACRELDKRLSRKEFLKDATGNYAPAIILLSDGEPNDDWEKGLAKLKQNNWFRVATKIAIGVDEENIDVFKEFTGSEETVLKVDSKDGNVLKKLLSRLAVVSSNIQSHSKPVSDEATGDEAAARDLAKEIVYNVQTEVDNLDEAEEKIIGVPVQNDDDWADVVF